MPRKKSIVLSNELLEIIDDVKKKARGRPRKDTHLPKIEEHKEEETYHKANDGKEDDKKEKADIKRKDTKKVAWDVPKDQEVSFFDADLSYEITGYRPISGSRGLDFDPSWFTETREVYLRTGHYCSFPRGTKAFADFWREQYKRCKYGMVVNGYTITGDHYFFLNFYLLKDLEDVPEAGGGRVDIFPVFLEGQYEWFHYLKLARVLKLNACMMKARSTGYSEMEAAIMANAYNCIRGAVIVATAYAERQLSKLLDKVWSSLNFLNNNTDGGFFKSRLVIDTSILKRASLYKIINGQRIEVGWRSQIQGIVADTSTKLRGDRTDILVFEEAGANPILTKTYTLSDALVGLIGKQFGLRLIGGTGGETGAAVEGLRKMYYNPRIFGILPFRHSFTLTGEVTLSSFFLPAFKSVKDPTILDNRGWCSVADGKKVFDATRNLKIADPIEYLTYCAEYCYNAEEAFSLEGDNKFNKINIAEQLTLIRALKNCPTIERGFIEYLYKEGIHLESNISGFKWLPNERGMILILEHPLWTLSEQHDEKGDIIWRPPAEPVRDLYVIGIDGIDIGAALTSDETRSPSDFCLVVYRRTYGLKEPLFVALYKDRPRDVRECYKIAIKLALYYNAVINIEATRLGIIPFARERNLLRLFMRRPRATLSDNMRNNNKQFGTPATAAIIAHQTDLISNYVEDYCHMIWFDEMLDELNRYSDANKNKFDIIAAMAMALLADEELLGVLPRSTLRVEDSWEDIGYYTDSEGHRRYGVLPKKQLTITGNILEHYEDLGPRTSDPRLYYGFV